MKWSTKSGHRVKVVKCHNEVNDDSRNAHETEVYGGRKRDAVALVTEHGYKISEAARSPDINDNQLRRCKQELSEETSGADLSEDERQELARLRKEVRSQRMEKEI